MVAAAIAWITCTPYGTGLLIGHWKRLNRTVARFIVPAIAIGWVALLVVVVGVLLRQEHGGVTAALVAAPFVGFAFWLPVRGDDPDDGPPDGPPPVDWDEFERARGEWDRSRGLQPV